MHETITIKTNIILTFIKDNNLCGAVLQSSNNNISYTLEELLYWNFIKNDVYKSYKSYDIFRKYHSDKKKIPSKSRLSQFNKKIASMRLYEKTYYYFIKIIYNSYNVIAIDSTFLHNKLMNCDNPIIGRNPFYKSKYGAKMTIVIDTFNKLPLAMSFDSSSKNDSSLAMDIINNTETKSIFENKFFLADAGYDSAIIKDTLKTINTISIIPINKRNTKSEKYKKEKEDIILKYKDIRRNYWDQIKNVRRDKKELYKIAQIKNKIKKIVSWKKKEIINLNYEEKKGKGKYKQEIDKKYKELYKKRTYIEHVFGRTKVKTLERINRRSMVLLANDMYERFIELLIFNQKNIFLKK